MTSTLSHALMGTHPCTQYTHNSDSFSLFHFTHLSLRTHVLYRTSFIHACWSLLVHTNSTSLSLFLAFSHTRTHKHSVSLLPEYSLPTHMHTPTLLPQSSLHSHKYTPIRTHTHTRTPPPAQTPTHRKIRSLGPPTCLVEKLVQNELKWVCPLQLQSSVYLNLSKSVNNH